MGNVLAKDAYGLAPLISCEITCETWKEESEDLLERDSWICGNFSLSSE